jgi:very-short-patch-repair endonuclease
MPSTRSRELRRNMTEAERRLWSALCDRRAAGFKFRRQHQIGHYIVDFFCPQARLIVEADGAQHEDEEQAWYDYRRTRWLMSRGYRVLRFRNLDVLRFPYQVVARIEEALVEAPPHPSRR